MGGESRRLTSTVNAEITTEDQSALQALNTSMTRDLVVGGATATASPAEVDIELVTTVTQATLVAAAPPSVAEVGTFLPGITATAVVSEPYGQSYAIAPCSTYTCPSGENLKANSDTLQCASSTCAASDSSTCCETPPGGGVAGGAVTISAYPFVTTLVVFA